MALSTDSAATAATAELVARVRSGEAVAFQELFDRYQRLVFSLALRLLGDAEESRDLCQEVFLTVHRRIASLRDTDCLRSWICRITVTRAHNVERSFRRRFRSSTVSLDESSDLATDAAADPERAAVSAEARRRIDDALARLPFAFRTVVVLRDIEGLTYEEIAEAVGIHIGTVRSRLARGRERLREALADLIESRPRSDA